MDYEYLIKNKMVVNHASNLEELIPLKHCSNFILTEELLWLYMRAEDGTQDRAREHYFKMITHELKERIENNG